MPSTFKTVLIDFKDTDQPDAVFLHGKSIWEVSGGVPIGVVADTQTHQYINVNTSIINRVAGTPLYWFYRLIDAKYYVPPPTHPQLPAGEESYFCVPFTSEHIIDHDTQAHTYGSYYPYHWMHLEVSGSVFAQGLLFNRATNAGDNLKRAYVNGVSWMDKVATAVGTAETNILGIAYIPCTDRLNT
jgi:hypothetical protein